MVRGLGDAIMLPSFKENANKIKYVFVKTPFNEKENDVSIFAMYFLFTCFSFESFGKWDKTIN